MNRPDEPADKRVTPSYCGCGHRAGGQHFCAYHSPLSNLPASPPTGDNDTYPLPNGPLDKGYVTLSDRVRDKPQSARPHSSPPLPHNQRGKPNERVEIQKPAGYATEPPAINTERGAGNVYPMRCAYRERRVLCPPLRTTGAGLGYAIGH